MKHMNMEYSRFFFPEPDIAGKYMFVLYEWK